MEMKKGYKQTEVGVIPEEWSVKSMGAIGEPLIGLTYKPSNVKSDGLLVLRASNIEGGTLRFDDNVFVDMEVPQKIIVRKGDILICVRNGSRELIGKCAKIDDRAQGLTFGAFMAVFRTPFHDFVYYQFQSEVVQRQIREHLGATINQITNKSLKSFLIPFPEEDAERHAIAEALGDVDALLGALGKLIAKKRDFKETAMQQILTGKTQLPGFIGEWGISSFDSVLRKVNSKEYQIQTAEYKTTGSFPVVDQGKDLVVGFSDREDKRFRCPEGGVIVFGDHTCIVKFLDVDFVVGADGTQILAAKTGHNARFHAFHLQHRGIATTGYNRHFKFLKERPFVVPPLDEQTAIAGVFSDMDAELAALEQRLAKTRALKQGMMQELLTGRVRLI